MQDYEVVTNHRENGPEGRSGQRPSPHLKQSRHDDRQRTQRKYQLASKATTLSGEPEQQGLLRHERHERPRLRPDAFDVAVQAHSEQPRVDLPLVVIVGFFDARSSGAFSHSRKRGVLAVDRKRLLVGTLHEGSTETDGNKYRI